MYAQLPTALTNLTSTTLLVPSMAIGTCTNNAPIYGIIGERICATQSELAASIKTI